MSYLKNVLKPNVDQEDCNKYEESINLCNKKNNFMKNNTTQCLLASDISETM